MIKTVHALILIAFGLSLPLSLPLAEPVAAAEPTFLPASRIGMVPPPGFVPSPSFLGFQHQEQRAAIMVAELPAAAFETIEKQAATELAAANQQRQDITLKDGGHGFVVVTQESGPQGPINKWTLVATAKNVTALVAAIVPEAVKEVADDAAIRAAFATLAVRDSVPVEEQLSALPFSMANLAGFRILRVAPGSAAMLTDGPKDVIEEAEQPLLLITIGPAKTQPPPEERDGLARRAFGEIPGLKDVRITRSEPLRIANQPGYELQATGRDVKGDHEVHVVQWLRFGAGSLLRIVGIARKETWEDTYGRFRQIRDGIGQK